MRLFIGIPLADSVLSEISAVVARLRSNADSLRWTASETWHITLQFLGDTTPAQYDCLLPHLAALRSPPVPVRLEKLGFFDRPGVFFADIAACHELVSLAQRVTAATALCGFVAEARLFHPHITLARAKGQGAARNRPLQQLKAKISRQPSFTPFAAHEFLLYESHLSPGGSIYEIRARFPLARPLPAAGLPCW